MLSRLYALWLLGTGLLVVVLKRVFVRRDPLRGFEARYGREGILAVTPEEHDLLGTPNRCTGCGACDDWGAQSGDRRRSSVRLFVLAGARSLPDADAGRALLRGLEASDLADAEARCPEGVPIRRLAALVESHARRRSAHES